MNLLSSEVLVCPLNSLSGGSDKSLFFPERERGWFLRTGYFNILCVPFFNVL
jgi:hypothetical protein